MRIYPLSCSPYGCTILYKSNIMRDPGFVDEQRNADLLDALADTFADQQEAMRESNPEEWIGYELELSDAEVNACSHYNERYVYSSSY
jgi:hypothetical protein